MRQSYGMLNVGQLLLFFPLPAVFLLHLFRNCWIRYQTSDVRMMRQPQVLYQSGFDFLCYEGLGVHHFVPSELQLGLSEVKIFVRLIILAALISRGGAFQRLDGDAKPPSASTYSCSFQVVQMDVVGVLARVSGQASCGSFVT